LTLREQRKELSFVYRQRVAAFAVIPFISGNRNKGEDDE